MVVVGGGELVHLDLMRIKPEQDFIITADAGLLPLVEAGITPHLAVGDFDTLGLDRLTWLKKLGIPFIQLPFEKGMTDLHFAVEEALKVEPDEVVILGAYGGARIDHALANIGLLEWIEEQGGKGVIYHHTNRLRLLVAPIKIYLNQEVGYSYVSLLPISRRVEGITTSGMRYPLQNGVLIRGRTLGISNELNERTAHIEIHKGKCLLIESSDHAFNQ
ncbi:thiamine diphosphokinase [Thermoflavimicrobium daqui]|uniref:thiamine diphosphokinase n=1 Tax=Thermoflavimicrobium daqui TaxID=2137476 RepID=UPI00143E020C|nr:thiamine diphosphokinase [Thermoflavimicrobium daqui]